MLASIRNLTGRFMTRVRIEYWIRPVWSLGKRNIKLRRDYKPTLLSPQEAAAFTKRRDEAK